MTRRELRWRLWEAREHLPRAFAAPFDDTFTIHLHPDDFETLAAEATIVDDLLDGRCHVYGMPVTPDSEVLRGAIHVITKVVL